MKSWFIGRVISGCCSARQVSDMVNVQRVPVNLPKTLAFEYGLDISEAARKSVNELFLLISGHRLAVSAYV